MQFQLKHSVFLLSLMLVSGLILTQLTHLRADEASPSTTMKENLKEVVKKEVEKRLKTINKRPIGIAGKLIDITSQELTVVTFDQKKHRITTSALTEYQRFPGKRSIERDDLSINDYLLIKGTQLTDQPVVDATVVQVISEPELPEYKLLVGSLTLSGKKEASITTNDKQEWGGQYTSATDWLTRSDKGLVEIKNSQVETSDTVAILGVVASQKPPTIEMKLVLKLSE